MGVFFSLKYLILFFCLIYNFLVQLYKYNITALFWNFPRLNVKVVAVIAAAKEIGEKTLEKTTLQR